MKGLKIWALLGGFAVAASCTSAFAEDTKPTAKAPQFNEATAGDTSRGVALDELFASFKRKLEGNKTEPQTAAPVAAAKPLAVKTVSHKAPTAVKKQVAVASTKTPGPGAKVVKPAIYTHTGSDANSILAVSSAGPNGPIITASLDKPGAVPKYKSGDRMTVKLHARQDCNVLVFDYDSKGTLTQLFPNEFEPDGALKAGSEVEIGGSNSKYDLTIDGRGFERIFVYAYPTSEGPITVAMNPVANSPFRSVELSPDQYRRLVKESKIYFGGHDRGVKVTPKAAPQQVSKASVESEVQPNKLELTFQIDK